MHLFEMLVNPGCVRFLLSKDITVLEQHRVAEIIDLKVGLRNIEKSFLFYLEIQKNKEMLGKKGRESNIQIYPT